MDDMVDERLRGAPSLRNIDRPIDDMVDERLRGAPSLRKQGFVVGILGMCLFKLGYAN